MRRSHPQLLNILLDDAMITRKEFSYIFQHENYRPYFFHIGNIEQHAIALLKLNQQVKDLLSSQLQPWCRIANYRRNILVLEIANANCMMALSCEKSNLISALRKKILPSLTSIDIKINPGLMARGDEIMRESAKCAASTEKSVPLRRLSIKSAEELKKLAKCCPKKLRVVLERFATLTKN